MACYSCGPTALGSRASWSVTSPVEPTSFDRPLSGNYDRIFNAFERTNAFECVKSTFEGKEERQIGHSDVVVNRKMSSSFERADCALAAQTPCDDDEDLYREKILYSQARQLFPLQEDLADWINKIIGITYLNGENFLDVLDNGVELCQLAAVIHDRAREALDQGLIVGVVPAIRGKCWQRAARRSFFSRDNAENFITFCRELGVHENLLFESDDLVLHNQPRQVILCLLEVARLATRYNVEPPGLVALEKEIALEERDSGLDSAMSGAAWQFRDITPPPKEHKSKTETTSASPDPIDNNAVDNSDAVSTKSEDSARSDSSADTDVPLRPTNELDKRVQTITRLLERGCRCGSGKCSRMLKVKKVGEGRYNIAGRNVFIRLLKGRHMMVRVGGGWDTLEHFLSRHEPCQVRLVTPARQNVLPLAPAPTRKSVSPAGSKASLSRDSGTTSPIDSKASSVSAPAPALSVSPAGSKASLSRESISGTISPIDNKSSVSSGRVSPDTKTTRGSKFSPLDVRRASTPIKPRPRVGLSLPLEQKALPRTRKQSAPAVFGTGSDSKLPARSTRPANEQRKPFVPAVTKKSRSMSLAHVQPDRKFCGTERLNKSRSASIAGPEPDSARSRSLASTPLHEPTRLYTKKTRSMSLIVSTDVRRPPSKSVSVGGGAPMTQASIEESIRASLEATIADVDSPKKPFLHIKAKYRSPPPREVPPR